MTHKYEAIYPSSHRYKTAKEWVTASYEFYCLLEDLEEASIEWVYVRIGNYTHHFVTTEDGEVYEYRFDEELSVPHDIKYLGLGKTD